MTRYVIDAGAAIRLALDDVVVAAGDEWLAPTLLRSETLSALHSAVHRGEMTEEEARKLLTRLRAMRIRLLGDRVLQDVAWKFASQMEWAETFNAEYIALTRLQADAFITLDAELAVSAREFVTVAPIEALYRAKQ